jgi:hypothetical protein
MILKIQKPLSGNVEPPEILVYNEDRSVTESIPMSWFDIHELFGDDVKQYWDGDIIEANGTKNIELHKQVKAQPW